MGQMITAPLLYGQRQPRGVEDIEVEDPQMCDVMMKMTASVLWDQLSSKGIGLNP